MSVRAFELTEQPLPRLRGTAEPRHPLPKTSEIAQMMGIGTANGSIS